MSTGHLAYSLFGNVVQPDSLSLFSSTSSDPFALWARHQDHDLEEDSGIRVLVDATDEVAPGYQDITPKAFRLRTDEAVRGSCSEPVLHIQSPAIRNTYIRSPPSENTELGIKLCHITLQFRAIGSSRPYLFEVGIRSDSGQRGVIRISSFQNEPKLYLKSFQDEANGTDERRITKNGMRHLLHLPLAVASKPEQDEASLTAWQVVTLRLDELVKHFSDITLISSEDTAAESAWEMFGGFHSISYVKVHANMRLRRVWCSQHLPDHDLAEFQVFS